MGIASGAIVVRDMDLLPTARLIRSMPTLWNLCDVQECSKREPDMGERSEPKRSVVETLCSFWIRGCVWTCGLACNSDGVTCWSPDQHAAHHAATPSTETPKSGTERRQERRTGRTDDVRNDARRAQSDAKSGAQGGEERVTSGGRYRRAEKSSPLPVKTRLTSSRLAHALETRPFVGESLQWREQHSGGRRAAAGIASRHHRDTCQPTTMTAARSARSRCCPDR